jgi:hypothetical protein
MSCCAGIGIIRVRHEDGSPDLFGLCLCAAGLKMRDDRNAGRHTGTPLWHVWAAAHQIAFDRVVPIEDVFDEGELAHIPRADAATPAATIADAMRTKGPRL